jgi:O-antigen/teichoic acid export membrane protein
MLKTTISKKIFFILSFFYEKIFHEKISIETRDFFKDISYIFIGTILGTGFALIFNIFAGRVLTPSGYGEFTLVITIAMFIYIPMLLGVSTAMVKYNAEKNNRERQTAIISTTYQLVFIFIIIFVAIYYILSYQFSNIFSVSQSVFCLSLIYAILFVMYTLVINTFRSLHWMKKVAYLTLGYNGIVLLIFIFFVFSNENAYIFALLSVFLGYGIAISSGIFLIRKYLKFGFSKFWAKKLLKYGLLVIIAGFSFVLYTNIDKLLIYVNLGVDQVGIYRAYAFASINLIGMFVGIFITVYFPTASKQSDKRSLFDKIHKSIPYLVLFGLPFTFFSEFIILKLYGDNYPIELLLIILFGIAAILLSINSLYAWTLNSAGTQGLKITCLGAVTLAVINIILNVLLIPIIGMVGAISSTIIATSISILLISHFGKIRLCVTQAQ